jgi:hypothetical protein
VIRGCRPRVTKQLVDQPISGNSLIRTQEEKREERPLPRTADPQRSIPDPDLERAKDTELDTVAAHRRLGRSVLQKRAIAKAEWRLRQV